MALPRRAKKIIGTTILIVTVPFYAMVVSAISAARLVEASTLQQVAFFAFFGLIWVVPAAIIVKWMADPKPPSP